MAARCSRIIGYRNVGTCHNLGCSERSRSHTKGAISATIEGNVTQQVLSTHVEGAGHRRTRLGRAKVDCVGLNSDYRESHLTARRLNANHHLLIDIESHTIYVGKSIECKVAITSTTPTPVDVILVGR